MKASNQTFTSEMARDPEVAMRGFTFGGIILGTVGLSIVGALQKEQRRFPFEEQEGVNLTSTTS